MPHSFKPLISDRKSAMRNADEIADALLVLRPDLGFWLWTTFEENQKEPTRVTLIIGDAPSPSKDAVNMMLVDGKFAGGDDGMSLVGDLVMNDLGAALRRKFEKYIKSGVRL